MRREIRKCLDISSEVLSTLGGWKETGFANVMRLTLTCLSCVYPYFANIPKAKWYTFSGSSHMSNIEQPERYMGVLSQFLMSA